MSSSGASAEDPTAEAVGATRTVAKWLVTTFGVLGAALIGSLSLAGLHELSDSGQRTALWGFALAMVGVLLALIPTALVLTPFALTLSELASHSGTLRRSTRRRLSRWIDRRPDIVGEHGSLEALNNKYRQYRHELHQAEQARLKKITSKTYKLVDDDYDIEVALRRLAQSSPPSPWRWVTRTHNCFACASVRPWPL